MATLSRAFMTFFNAIFSLCGLALLAFGLWTRFALDQWMYMQGVNNGVVMVYIYIGVGAGIFVLSILGQLGAGYKGNSRRLPLAIYIICTLAVFIVSLYGTIVLFGITNDSKVFSGEQIQQNQRVQDEIQQNLTPAQLRAVEKYNRPLAIFLAVLSGVEFLLLICSFALMCERRQQQSLPSYYAHSGTPPQQPQAQAAGVPVQFA